ncbi:hypothetical protein [Rheinheimera aquimaris]|uniref:hypothetical protein n=1 Tax=Rheinheimera aquimaris TaxID=412437 RepID=UPI001066936B|nr:hypothetical protein [Rheinheimera aquimaris]
MMLIIFILTVNGKLALVVKQLQIDFGGLLGLISVVLSVTIRTTKVFTNLSVFLARPFLRMIVRKFGDVMKAELIYRVGATAL